MARVAWIISGGRDISGTGGMDMFEVLLQMSILIGVAIAVGDALSTRVQRAFGEAFGKILWNGYGSSETGPALVNTTGAADEDAAALGRPYPGVRVTLRDEDDVITDEGPADIEDDSETVAEIEEP